MNLQNKYAVVTGASTGIGRAIAVKLGKEGAFCALIGRTKTKLEETESIINNNGASAKVFISDLSEVQSINQLINSIRQDTECVDVLANVAGIWHGENEVYADKNFETFTQQIILDTYTVGLTAPSLLAHSFIPLIPKNGKIVNISGTFENGAKGWLPYFVSKKAIEDLTIGLAEELIDKEIQVNAISPSDTATEAYEKFFPQYIDESIDPKKIAEYALYLCSEKANDITGKIFVMKQGKDPYEGYHS